VAGWLMSASAGSAFPARLVRQSEVAETAQPVSEPQPEVPSVGAVIGEKYQVERVLGNGAMGIVVAARHVLLGHAVAIKLLAGPHEARPASLKRFLREARAIAALASDHVVRLFDFGTSSNGAPFIVMQYLAGRDLEAEVRARGGPLSPTDAVDFVIQACAGLAAAHAQGIVHRDIKPSNLFLTRRSDGSPLVVVIDFGISKMATWLVEDGNLTSSQTTLGSPLYMSPEQIRDAKAVDLRTDIWSLGAVLWFLLSGKPAFAAGDASATIASVIADELMPLRRDAPNVSQALEEIVARCLQKKADFRYPSGADLARALAPHASTRGRELAAAIGLETNRGLHPRNFHREDTSLELQPPGATFATTTRGLVNDTASDRYARRATFRVAATLLGVAAVAALGFVFARVRFAAESIKFPVGARTETSQGSTAVIPAMSAPLRIVSPSIGGQPAERLVEQSNSTVRARPHSLSGYSAPKVAAPAMRSPGLSRDTSADAAGPSGTSDPLDMAK